MSFREAAAAAAPEGVQDAASVRKSFHRIDKCVIIGKGVGDGTLPDIKKERKEYVGIRKKNLLLFGRSVVWNGRSEGSVKQGCKEGLYSLHGGSASGKG